MTHLITWFLALAIGIALGYSRGRIDGATGLSRHLVAHGHLSEPLAELTVKAWKRRKK